MQLFDSGLNVLLIMIGFGLLIFVHELGHFLAAKWSGIRTEGFSIGFGPPICSWRKGVGLRVGSTDPDVVKRAGKRATELTDEELAEHGLGETEYALRWLPLGGFVKMLGQDDVDPSATSTSPRSFNRSPISRRMVVISAGVVMNLLFAAVLFVIAFTAGVRFESPIIGEVEPGSPAALAEAIDPPEGYTETVGLRPGDRVLSIDGSAVNTFGDIQIATAMGRLDRAHDVRVQRDGVTTPLQFSITPVKHESSGLLGIGVWPGYSLQLTTEPEMRPMVDAELQRLGLAEQGVEPGMTIESIDGEPGWNWEAFSAQSERSDGDVMSTVWVRPKDESGRVERLEVDMTAAPEWERLLYPSASPAMSVAYEKGLMGLVPLVSIGSVADSSPNLGILMPGDLVLKIGDEQAPRMRTFRDTKNEHGPGILPMSILRNGERIEVEARVVDTGILDPKPLLGVSPEYGWKSPRIARPMEYVEGPKDVDGYATTIKTPLAGLGIRGGSTVLTVDGESVADWEGIWRGVHAAATAGHGHVTLELESPTPGREVRSIDVPLDAFWTEQAKGLGWVAPVPFYCFDPLYTVRSSDGNPLLAVSMGLQETTKLVVLTYLTIDRLFRGTLGVEQLHGPVGIVHLGSKVADRGFTYLLFFLGLISVNLAVINFLPLPIVDGGLFLYLVYEKIKGRPPSVGFQNGAALIGLMLIATAFVVTFYNDILRLIG